MARATVSPKFQIVIPKEIRERYELKPGQQVALIDRDGYVALVPQRPISELRGIPRARRWTATATRPTGTEAVRVLDSSVWVEYFGGGPAGRASAGTTSRGSARSSLRSRCCSRSTAGHLRSGGERAADGDRRSPGVHAVRARRT